MKSRSVRGITRRRALIGAGAAVLGASALEYASFRGACDHRRMRVRGRERYDASMKALRSAAGPTTALLHLCHSTHLLVVDSVRFLTDPWFYDPAFGALEHEVGPPVPPAEIEGLDCVVVTHDHADHFDLRALDQMQDKGVACFVATKGMATQLKGKGFSDVHVLAPWESAEVKGVRVWAVPGLHDVYEIGYVLQGKTRTCYFAGDTALHPDLRGIAERFSPHLSVLPVDGTRLRGGDLHVMRPGDAVEAARTLGSRVLLPSHAEALFYDPSPSTSSRRTSWARTRSSHA